MFCIGKGGNASCKSWATAINEEIIMSLNEVQAEEKEADRWNVLFKSFIYWLSQFGAEASNSAGNNSGEETVTAG